MSIPDDTHLIVYNDEIGFIHSKLLTLPFGRVREHFMKRHKGTECLPEAVRQAAIPLMGIYKFNNGKWEITNG